MKLGSLVLCSMMTMLTSEICIVFNVCLISISTMHLCICFCCLFSDVRINNIKHAMISPLQHPAAGFEDVIKTHFFVKRERILQVILYI